MPKYLIQGGYTPEGTKGVRKDGGSKRRQAAEALIKEVGGNSNASTSRLATRISSVSRIFPIVSLRLLCRLP